MEVGQGFFSMESLGGLWLVFDTGLSVTPLIGHLGCLASHWSVPVGYALLLLSPVIVIVVTSM